MPIINIKKIASYFLRKISFRKKLTKIQLRTLIEKFFLGFTDLSSVAVIGVWFKFVYQLLFSAAVTDVASGIVGFSTQVLPIFSNLIPFLGNAATITAGLTMFSLVITFIIVTGFLLLINQFRSEIIRRGTPEYIAAMINQQELSEFQESLVRTRTMGELVDLNYLSIVQQNQVRHFVVEELVRVAESFRIEPYQITQYQNTKIQKQEKEQ